MRNYIIVLFSLCLGLTIYLGFRATSNPFYQIMKKMGLQPFIDQGRELLSDVSLPLWVIYSLPDALWMFAFVLFIFTIWDCTIDKNSQMWIYGCIVLGLGFEMIQAGVPHVGVFDWIDLFSMILSAFLVIKFFKKTEMMDYRKLNKT